ncbi:hypothetical protein EYF80_012130 [Liparis tanakae]|uniref:Uncharacterized protein n=1 Tax=Liparis tanakae TaxID=230148 RepID=A0A4Z2IHT4_9TELE|nr:hypothetical protein EYF80_012130 [Liparis tanakae]
MAAPFPLPHCDCKKRTSQSGTSLRTILWSLLGNLEQHCHQSGSAQVCGSCGYYLTHPLSGDAVLNRRVQTQVPEHFLRARQTFLVPAGTPGVYCDVKLEMVGIAEFSHK